MMTNRVAFEMGRLDEARRGYDEILAAEQTTSFAEVHFAALYDRGRIAQRQGNREEAIGFFARAIDALEAQRASIGQDRYKLGFVENRLAVYDDMVLAQVSAGRADAAFEYAERAKARALVDLLADRTSFGGSAKPDRERLRTALTTLKALEARPIQVARADTAGDDATRGLTIEGIRQEIRTETGELASLVSVETVSAGDIRANLSDREVLVEYFQAGDRLIAFVVTGRRLEAVDLDGRGLAEAVAAFRTALQDKTSDAWQAQAKALYDRLLRPIEDRLDAPLLTVVPQGPLNYLPFAALHDGRGVVADRLAVRVLPSASVLKYLRLRGPAANRALLALGNPDVGDASRDLPGAEVETQAIAARWPSARRLVRANASETLFKENGGTFGYLHLASHGEFDPENPLESGLLLAPDARNDGRLTVSEIYELELDAELITLSACETALGDLAGGDEVVGLTRGFLYAGARSVVASLWQVSDNATAELMERFYEELKRNTPAEALRRAQLDTKRAFKHPYYWAAFQLNGNG